MSKIKTLRKEMAASMGDAKASLIDETKALVADLQEFLEETQDGDDELREITDIAGLSATIAEINAKAGYQKATLHRGELMKPAVDMPPWGVAYMDAVREVYALCRPSSLHLGAVQVGDWFNLTRNVPTAALPKALKIGVSQGYTFDFKKRTPPKQRFCMIRLPLARFWHPAWRPIINQAIIGSSSDA